MPMVWLTNLRCPVCCQNEQGDGRKNSKDEAHDCELIAKLVLCGDGRDVMSSTGTFGKGFIRL